jgi:Leucine-rich repeat (LRR) protein
VIKKYFLILICFLASNQLYSQENTIVYDDLETALTDPAKVEKYYLDCESEGDSAFVSNIKKFTNLKSLTIVGYSGERLPVAIFSSQSIISLCISECTGINFNSVFRDIVALKQLRTLIVDECDLLQVSSELSLLPDLNKLVITNCENLNLEKTIENIAGCRKLKYLGLPVNQICEIPSNIGLIKQLEVIDISNNIVYDLPESMAMLNNLQTLNMEGNIFINPVNSLSKISSLQIKYLSIDNDLADTDRERLKKLFPNTVIVEKDASNNLSYIDSLNIADSKPDDSVTYGTFNTIYSSGNILSEAYLHFADVFGDPRLLPTFDSLLFDERYHNLSYANTLRITNAQTAYNWNTPRIFMWKKNWVNIGKKQFAFNFYTKDKAYPSAIALFNKEITVFRGMYWVYDGDLTKKQFKKKYTIIWRGASLAGNNWNDIRIYYDDVAKTFTIELKNLRGFERFVAHPVNENINDPELSKEQYSKKYTRYLNSLDSRRRRFNKRLLRDKATYNKNHSKLFQGLWKGFSEDYFSEQEKQMTQKEWLQYYDWIIANEKEAFANAPVESPLFKRFLTINRYVENVGGTNVIFDSVPRIHLVNFVDKDMKKQVTKDIFIVNTLNKVYSSSFGTLNFKPNSVLLGPSKNVALIVFFRNGNIGVMKSSDFAKLDLKSNAEMDIKLDILDFKLVTFGQLAAAAGL